MVEQDNSHIPPKVLLSDLLTDIGIEGKKDVAVRKLRRVMRSYSRDENLELYTGLMGVLGNNEDPKDRDIRHAGLDILNGLHFRKLTRNDLQTIYLKEVDALQQNTDPLISADTLLSAGMILASRFPHKPDAVMSVRNTWEICEKYMSSLEGYNGLSITSRVSLIAVIMEHIQQQSRVKTGVGHSTKQIFPRSQGQSREHTSWQSASEKVDPYFEIVRGLLQLKRSNEKIVELLKPYLPTPEIMILIRKIETS